MLISNWLHLWWKQKPTPMFQASQSVVLIFSEGMSQFLGTGFMWHTHHGPQDSSQARTPCWDCNRDRFFTVTCLSLAESIFVNHHTAVRMWPRLLESDMEESQVQKVWRTDHEMLCEILVSTVIFTFPCCQGCPQSCTWESWDIFSL